MTPGPWQILIVALIILVLFGASRLADIGKGLGEGIRNFKKGIADDGSGSGDKVAARDPKQLSEKGESAADQVEQSSKNLQG